MGEETGGGQGAGSIGKMAPIRFTIFRFVIKSFGRYRGVRPLTQAFDMGLNFLTMVTAPSVHHAIGKIRREIRSWPDVKHSSHKLGGHQFNWRGEELGHIHSNGVADLKLTFKEKDEVIRGYLAVPHHVVPTNSWVTFYIERGDQVQHVVDLFRIPYQRLTAAGGSSEKPSEEYVQ